MIPVLSTSLLFALGQKVTVKPKAELLRQKYIVAGLNVSAVKE